MIDRNSDHMKLLAKFRLKSCKVFELMSSGFNSELKGDLESRGKQIQKIKTQDHFTSAATLTRVKRGDNISGLSSNSLKTLNS